MKPLLLTLLLLFPVPTLGHAGEKEFCAGFCCEAPFGCSMQTVSGSPIPRLLCDTDGWTRSEQREAEKEKREFFDCAYKWYEQHKNDPETLRWLQGTYK